MSHRKGSKVSIADRKHTNFGTVLGTQENGKINIETVTGKHRTLSADKLTTIPAKEYAAVEKQHLAAVAKKAEPSKRSVCVKIFSEAAEGTKRADIINLFIEKAGLTKNGASTYYQNCKSANWTSPAASTAA